jgi:NADH-quinone oxidoreductase subunit C
MSAAQSDFQGRLAKELPPLLDNMPLDFKSKDDWLASIGCDKGSILKLCTILSERYGFEHLSLITTVDRIDRFELIYHVTSYQNHCMLEIRVAVPKSDAKVPSVTPVWGGANWHEREAYDMMGIVFEGHPDPRRILLPQDYLFFPLRKDFRMEGE